MANRTGNYSAFYVAEPYNESNLGPNSAKDFIYYNLLRAWKKSDSSFPFVDSHQKNYNVRDGSDWESTLKPRLRDRLGKSKNIVLFLSSNTKNSKALREELDYGINEKELPVIVVYTDFNNESDIINSLSKTIEKQVKDLWDSLPVFKNYMNKVPTIHIPLKKDLIEKALGDPNFSVSSKTDEGIYFY